MEDKEFTGLAALASDEQNSSADTPVTLPVQRALSAANFQATLQKFRDEENVVTSRLGKRFGRSAGSILVTTKVSKEVSDVSDARGCKQTSINIKIRFSDAESAPNLKCMSGALAIPVLPSDEKLKDDSTQSPNNQLSEESDQLARPTSESPCRAFTARPNEIYDKDEKLYANFDETKPRTPTEPQFTRSVSSSSVPAVTTPKIIGAVLKTGQIITFTDTDESDYSATAVPAVVHNGIKEGVSDENVEKKSGAESCSFPEMRDCALGSALSPPRVHGTNGRPDRRADLAASPSLAAASRAEESASFGGSESPTAIPQKPHDTSVSTRLRRLSSAHLQASVVRVRTSFRRALASSCSSGSGLYGASSWASLVGDNDDSFLTAEGPSSTSAPAAASVVDSVQHEAAAEPEQNVAPSAPQLSEFDVTRTTEVRDTHAFARVVAFLRNFWCQIAGGLTKIRNRVLEILSYCRSCFKSSYTVHS
ncbi:uncharacterized protein LOC125179144 [Hyalella azteca]|uniref:Uncharacterized protein LOC125179144 n=1 Tax=Hyalella azteca TaxID=294128 RepID=A0A979FT43_HYAAZ|nr:uncharacterized protein LOC125179144 [Hyalella azteca]